MQYFQEVLTDTVISTSLWDAYDLIGYNGAKITGADAVVAGVAKHPNTVIGDPGAIIRIGTARLKAVGAISAGGAVVSAAAGGVQAQGAGTNRFGRALNAAADGEFVTIVFSIS
ncbi:hypothetical protein GCM10007291_50520 [Gemmobacter nanjingensis]|jgi:hypothetical protein|uniref:DUF2190 family protein n=1 Tax=Gemmobacter nanjingensis TaxID=488454 RepID=A0ABQ3FUW9_9RHOB|nr:capsid cement protein [Gemmobacter nanjingensis]GHC42791.1 hypothetical protein GCM10007291_50520 [Gemmobacter nanjingensis]